ncbi:MAG TPA: SBBP repeat-containing protein [Nitrospiria bacterium]|nr:SBBP repeat-containing protein [Nitrospiria bacterium]
MAYGGLPQNFIPNMGQLNPRVKFYEKGGGHAAFFTKGGVDLTLYNGDPFSVSHPVPSWLRLTPLGAQKNPEIVGEGLQKGRVNYLIGHDPRKWRTGLPIYRAVVYKEIYPGIDMKFYGGDRQLEYDIGVKPGADPSRIRLSFEGARGLRLAENGDLRILIDGGEIVQKKPRVYQEIDGRRREVPGKFTLLGPQPAARGPKYIYGFDLASYDKNVPLVIDPTLVYSTYLGGSGDEHGYSIAVDASGFAYVSGFTTSADLVPSEYCTGVYDCSFNGGPSDAFVAKVDPSASGSSSLRYLTYLGGSQKEDNGVVAGSIAVDASGDAYVTGVTSSSDFPTTPNAYQSSHQGGFDAFVAKLDPTGSKLLYSTYLGGNRNDTGRSIAIDASGRAYVTGETNSTNLVPPRLCKVAYDCSYVGISTDAFVAKLDPAGSGPAALQYVTYLGGSDLDVGFSIAVDAEGRAVVTGETNSYDFPATPGAFDVTCGTDGFCDDGVTDVFVSKIDPSRPGAASLVYSTFLGGSGFDSSNPVNSLAVDRNGDVYVTGCTASEDYPTTPGAYMNRRAGGCDIFATKLRPDPSGPTPDPSDLLYSTFLGGRSYDDAWGIAVDPAGLVYLTGFTWSKDYPVTPGAVSKKLAGGVGDVFVSILKPDPSGPTPDPSDLLYSTYLGGGGADSAYGIAVDGSGRVFLTGETTSNNFPTSPGGFDRKYHGGYDAFVAELAFPDLTLSDVRFNSGTVRKGESLSVTDTVQNRGPIPAENFQIGYRLSVNTVFGDSDDVVIHETRTIGALAAGKSNTATTSLTIPASTPPNTYHICAGADDSNTVAEKDETNNSRCATATINVQ